MLTGCVRAPVGVTPVKGFEINRYLGKWYEIARLNHRFERGMTKVTAEYSLRPDGNVRVFNRGFDTASGRWREIEGRAKFVGKPDTGFLKVSFFRPIYGAYVIIELDKTNYNYALVAGPDTSYLWILSRSPVMEETAKRQLVARAKELGFDTSKLIDVEQ